MKTTRIFAGLCVLLGTTATLAQTRVSGAIESDTTWARDLSPYRVTETVSVNNGAVLTIEPGVTVHFAFEQGLKVSAGGLIARGTPEQHIVFTSESEYLDRPRAPGDWGSLVFEDGTVDESAVLSWVDIRYGGGVLLESASPSLENVSLDDNLGAAVAQRGHSKPSLQNVRMQGNGSNAMHSIGRGNSEFGLAQGRGAGRGNGSEAGRGRGRGKPPVSHGPPGKSFGLQLPFDGLRSTGVAPTNVISQADEKAVGVCPAALSQSASMVVGGDPLLVTIDQPYTDQWISFEAQAGQHVTLSGLNNTFGWDGVYVFLYMPDANGNASVDSGLWTSWDWLGPYDPGYSYQDDFVDFYELPYTGTYLLKLDPWDTETGSVTVVLNDASDRDVGQFSLPSTQTFGVQVPGQCVNGEFAGTAGQTINVNRLQDSFINDRDVWVGVYYPADDGSATTDNGYLGSRWLYEDGLLALPPLPVTGNYTVQTCEWWDGTGDVSLQFTERPADVVTGIAIDAPEAHAATSTPGQRLYFDFVATKGQRIAPYLVYSDYPSSPDVSLVRRNGSTDSVQDSYGSVASGYSADLFVVPSDGTYSIRVSPRDKDVGSATVGVVSVSFGTSDVMAIGSLKSISQRSALVFDGLAGQALQLKGTNESFGSYVRYTLYAPDGSGVASVDGTYLTSWRGYYSSSFTSYLPVLPNDGQYTLTVDPAKGSSGSVDLTLFDPSSVPPPPPAPADLVVTMAIGDTIDTPVNMAEQNVRVTFDAVAGESFNLSVIQHSFSTSYSHPLKIYEPAADGSASTSTTLIYSSYLANGRVTNQKTAAKTGTYTILIDPVTTTTGSVRLELNVPPGDVTTTASIGDTVAVDLQGLGERGIVYFDAQAGDAISLDVPISTVLGSSLSYYLYYPDIDGVASTSAGAIAAGSLTTGSYREEIPLSRAGTYTLVFYPQYQQSGSINLQISPVNFVDGGMIDVDGADVALDLGTAYDHGWLRFWGEAGQKVVVTVVDETFAGSPYMQLGIPRDDCSATYYWDWDWSTSAATAGVSSDVQTLTRTGYYSLYVDPNRKETGSITLRVSSAPVDASATLAIGGDAQTIETTVPYQNGMMTFHANEGDRFNLKAIASTFAPAPYVWIYRPAPDGSPQQSWRLNSYYSQYSAGSQSGVIVAPLTGTYSVVINPTGTQVGSITLQLDPGPPDVNGQIAIDGGPLAVPVAEAYQRGLITFDGTAGQVVGVSVTQSNSITSQVRIFNPAVDGSASRLDGVLATETIYPWSGYRNGGGPVTLPSTGTYTIEFISSNSGSVTLDLTTVPPPVSATLLIGGSAVSFSTVPFQTAELTFQGNAGDRINLATTASSGFGIYASDTTTIFSPTADGTASTFNGVVITYSSYGVGSQSGLITLARTGVYTVRFDPVRAESGSITYALQRVPNDFVGSIEIDGVQSTVSTVAYEQNGSLTFSASAGQRVNLTLTASNVPSWVRVYLYRPAADGSASNSSGYVWVNYYMYVGNRSDVVTLPDSGVYTIGVFPRDGVFGNWTFDLNSVPPDVTGTLEIDGPLLTLATTAEYQNAVATFSGNSGQRVNLSMRSNTVGGQHYVRIFKPAGDGSASVNAGTLWTGYMTTGSISDLLTLDATGTYTVHVDAPGTSIGEFSLELDTVPADLSMATEVDAAPATLPDLQVAQNGVLTFSALAGQLVSVVHVDSTSNSTPCVYLYRPSNLGVATTSNGYDWSSCSLGVGGWSSRIQLTITGVYTLVVDPQGAASGSRTYRIESLAIAIDSPVHGATLSSDQTITTVTDAAANITSVDFYVDGEWLATDTTAPFTADWAASAATSGTHELKAVAKNTGVVIGQSVVPVDILKPADPQPSLLLNESFADSTASGWTLIGSASMTGGSTDAAGQGWLRLTPAATNQTGFAYYYQTISTTDMIELSFEFAEYGGGGADGLAFFLSDAGSAFVAGSGGGHFGYTNMSNGALAVGVSDNYGSAFVGGYYNAIAIRGPGPSTALLKTTGTLAIPLGASSRGTNLLDPNFRRLRLRMEPQAEGETLVTVMLDSRQNQRTVISSQLVSGLPPLVRFGFSAATGSRTNIHEVRNLNLRAMSATNIDRVPPVIEQVSFNGSPLTDGATLTDSGFYSAHVTDDNDLRSVELAIDGSLVASSLPYNDTFRVPVDLAAYADGAHSLRLTATDVIGNVAQVTHNITVAIPVPTVPELLSPAEGFISTVPGVTVGGAATYGSTVQVYLDGAPVGARLVVDPDGRFSLPLTLAEGTHQITADAGNSRGTSALSAPLRVSYVVPVPQILITSPAEGAAMVRSGPVAASVIDPSGISQVEFLVDGQSLGVDTGAPYEVQWIIDAVADGEHSLTVTAVNGLGRSNSATRAITVAKEPPPPPPFVAPYVGADVTATPALSFGTEPVHISGRMVDQQGQNVPDAPVSLRLRVGGFERSINLVADAAGTISFDFVPQSSDQGRYGVALLHPDEPVFTEQASFSISRLRLEKSRMGVSAARAIPQAVAIKVTAAPGVSASGVRLVAQPSAQPSGSLPAGISIDSEMIDLTAGQTGTLNLTLDSTSASPEYGTVILTLLASESGSTSRGSLRLDYRLYAPTPSLYPTPTYVQVGVRRNEQSSASVTLENKGLIPATDVAAQLVDASGGSNVPAWISLSGPVAAEGLDVGAQRELVVTAAPDASVADGVYDLGLKVTASNTAGGTVPVSVLVTQQGDGSVHFSTADIYTSTTDAQGNLILGVAGASIRLQNEAVPTIRGEGTTDANGEVTVGPLPAGRYSYRAYAKDHVEASGRVLIQPGVTVDERVFLDFSLVSVEWSVVETSIQDQYDVVLTATYQTEVPAPVVLMEPASINLPDMQLGEQVNGIVTVTNYGLIRADNVVLSAPAEDAYYRVEFLGELPSSLDAKQRVTLPYRITALSSTLPFKRLDLAGVHTKADAACYSTRASVHYDYVCAAGDLRSGGTGASFSRMRSDTCGGGAIFAPIGGGSGGWGGPIPTPATSALQCLPDCIDCSSGTRAGGG